MATVIAATALSTTATAQHREGHRNHVEARGGNRGGERMSHSPRGERHHDMRMEHRHGRHGGDFRYNGHPMMAHAHHHYNIHDRWHRGYVHHHGDVFRYLPCDARRCVVDGVVVYSLLDLIFRPIIINGVTHYMID